MIKNNLQYFKKYKININKKPYKGTYGFFYLFSVYNFKPKLRGLFDVLQPLNINYTQNDLKCLKIDFRQQIEPIKLIDSIFFTWL